MQEFKIYIVHVFFFQVYTSYRFKVRACTQVGCGDSLEVALSTDELPPSYVALPTLTVLGKS